MLRPAFLVLVLAGPAAAAQGGNDLPLLLAGGVMRFQDDTSRKAVSDQGLWFMAGAVDPGGYATFGGLPSIDLEYRRASGNGNKVDSYGAFYSERKDVLPLLYLGYSLGGQYHRLNFNGVKDDGWKFAAKGLVGSRIYRTLFVEASYLWTQDVGGFGLKSFSVGGGFWF